MPYCKSCHKEISRLDNDICPHCGEKNPIDRDYATKDVTSHIDPIAGEYELYKSKSHKVYAILCMTFGFLGIHDFYIGFWRRGVAFFSIFAILVGGIGTLLYFLVWKSFWAYLVLFFAFLFFDLALGVVLLKKEPLKDAEGEFLR